MRLALSLRCYDLTNLSSFAYAFVLLTSMGAKGDGGWALRCKSLISSRFRQAPLDTVDAKRPFPFPSAATSMHWRGALYRGG